MTGKDLLAWMRERGLTDYGCTISGEAIRAVLGIVVPRVGTWEDFNSVQVQMLNPIGYVRDALLAEGKYLRCERDMYRILLPSENAAQIRSFQDSADNKLRRAETLAKTTPMEHKDVRDNTEVRLAMMRSSLKESRLYGRPTQPTAH